MPSKNSTPAVNDEKSAAEIAAHIAAILNHPDTPVSVYNALAEAVNDLDAPKIYFDSEEYVEARLRNHFKAQR